MFIFYYNSHSLYAGLAEKEALLQDAALRHQSNRRGGRVCAPLGRMQFRGQRKPDGHRDKSRWHKGCGCGTLGGRLLPLSPHRRAGEGKHRDDPARDVRKQEGNPCLRGEYASQVLRTPHGNWPIGPRQRI